MDDRDADVLILKEQVKQLAVATATNTQVMGTLTIAVTRLDTTLSGLLDANKERLQNAFAFAGLITAVIGGIIGLYYWIVSIVHK